MSMCGLDPRDVNCPTCGRGVGKGCRKWRVVPVPAHPDRSTVGRPYAIGDYTGVKRLYGYRSWFDEAGEGS